MIDANDDSTTYRYTANGDVNDVTDAKGNTTHYEYDALSRLTQIVDDSNSGNFRRSDPSLFLYLFDSTIDDIFRDGR
ncbi:MAG: RHS repeat domain-containing protein [Planctomycetota bacterium]